MEKNLGHATAYGYAKSKGYSGTEEEFAELMADYASVGQSAAQSAEQAAASATSASGSAATATQAAQTATEKASEAVTAAGTATTKASEASTSADTASAAATSAGTSAQTATTAAATATTKASEASESATTAITAKTDAETARDAAAQSASAAAESARTLTIDATLTQAGQAADSKAVGDKVDDLKPLNLIGKKYATSTSGYQNVPISIDAGKYRATCYNAGSNIYFRDANNNNVGNVFIPAAASGFEFEITSEQAAVIKFLRMYQGADVCSVVIYPKTSIINRVDSLEQDVSSKASRPVQFSEEQITIEQGYMKTNGSVYQSGQHFTVNVSANAANYKISGYHANSNYPFLCEHDSNGNVVSAYSGTQGAVTDYVFVPNVATAYFVVNANNNGKCFSGEYVGVDELVNTAKAESLAYVDTKTYYQTYDLRQDREARYEMDKRNPFAWKPFDKAYFSWMNDDGRPDMYLYKNLCDAYNIPYANAVPWEEIKSNTAVIDGMSIVDYCKQIIADGGEIFTHANNPLTSASTEADIMSYFRDGKKIIEDALDTKIFGIIQAGGSGYSSFDYTEGHKFSLAYYEFSDAYGITPQYKLARTRFMRSSYESDEAQVDAYKAVIDDAITNRKWVRFFCHGTSEVSIAVLTQVFEYIATKVAGGTCAWTTWKSIYDSFRSTALEQRISALGGN